jgi:hypothetical protein
VRQRPTDYRRCRVLSDSLDPSEATPTAKTGPTITAKLEDGPLEGDNVELEVVEGRPPKTVDLAAADGTLCRYCLDGWVQTGQSALYTFLYRV